MREHTHASRKKAQERREAIAQLRKTDAFTAYLGPRLERRMSEAREALLHDLEKIDTPQKLWEARLVYLERREVALLLDHDDATARNILGSREPEINEL